AVALAEAAEEIFFGPSELEALPLDLQHLRHVAPDQPTDLDFQRLLLRLSPAHDGLLAIAKSLGLARPVRVRERDNIRGCDKETRRKRREFSETGLAHLA